MYLQGLRLLNGYRIPAEQETISYAQEALSANILKFHEKAVELSRRSLGENEIFVAE